MKSNSFYAERAMSILAAAILLQTLYFKFGAAPESVYIFSQLGVEPYGRIGAGVAELIAGALLLYRKTAHWGALLGIGIITGAIGAHLFILGISVQGDGGYLFGLAIIVLLACLGSLFFQREKVNHLVNQYT